MYYMDQYTGPCQCGLLELCLKVELVKGNSAYSSHSPNVPTPLTKKEPIITSIILGVWQSANDFFALL